MTGSGGLNKTGPGTLELASAAGNNYSGDTNVLAGTLMADTDNALSPASNLVIGDGASVVLNFGNVGAGFGLGGFGAAAAGRGTRTGRASGARRRPASRPCPSRVRWCCCWPGALAGLARMATERPIDGNADACGTFLPNPNPFLHAPLARLPWQVEK